jgi:hypothetical protein
LWIFLLPLAAQDPQIIPMDQEPHHRLVLQNRVVKVFHVELPPREAFAMHRHDTDDVAVLLDSATTVSTTPGQADVLTMSKAADVMFTRNGYVHSVRNIGHTAYRMISIELLHPQTGTHSICGTQLSNLKTECRAVRASETNAPPADSPQFVTDQIIVTLSVIAPHQSASFGEKGRDNLIILVDDAVIAPSGRQRQGQTLAQGSPVWIARGSAKQDLRNNTDKVLRVVTIAFNP